MIGLDEGNEVDGELVDEVVSWCGLRVKVVIGDVSRHPLARLFSLGGRCARCRFLSSSFVLYWIILWCKYLEFALTILQVPVPTIAIKIHRWERRWWWGAACSPSSSSSWAGRSRMPASHHSGAIWSVPHHQYSTAQYSTVQYSTAE